MKPCPLCPFRKDVKPYLTPERGVQLARSTRHRHHNFVCHESVKSLGGIGPRRTCIGFALMRAQEAGNRFIRPDDGIYMGMGEMMMAYLKEAK